MEITSPDEVWRTVACEDGTSPSPSSSPSSPTEQVCSPQPSLPALVKCATIGPISSIAYETDNNHVLAGVGSDLVRYKVGGRGDDAQHYHPFRLGVTVHGIRFGDSGHDIVLFGQQCWRWLRRTTNTDDTTATGCGTAAGSGPSAQRTHDHLQFMSPIHEEDDRILDVMVLSTTISEKIIQHVAGIKKGHDDFTPPPPSTASPQIVVIGTAHNRIDFHYLHTGALLHSIQCAENSILYSLSFNWDHTTTDSANANPGASILGNAGSCANVDKCSLARLCVASGTVYNAILLWRHSTRTRSRNVLSAMKG
eukprot:TRINITY_DN3928_c2_g1_i1.p1 TRINITY_DN3928_c2_g1~~TRINITY_DN3928_c2_g1_i1.p1  ORF type:complete len:309 (+),score=42.81 TRINITY_DN3928_c2_g1_i1:101-1027(+)